MRLQQSHDFHSVIQRDSACDCHRATRLSQVVPQAVKNSFSGRDVYIHESSDRHRKIALLLHTYRWRFFPASPFQRLLLSWALYASPTCFTSHTFESWGYHDCDSWLHSSGKWNAGLSHSPPPPPPFQLCPVQLEKRGWPEWCVGVEEKGVWMRLLFNT